ncbi:uncharacterized protein LOC114938112 [Nylanderia fulva]|uniref:uncharacterized protein LOC114938112 n=1 Tax=Nylanderia fulva TaxID=613905 RepID=UPI0010FB9109|nr:uncharacterized protein LOC114938112 [Nylanderia fulva]
MPWSPDDISLRMIRLALPIIMPVLEHVCNYSLTCGIYPEVWKSALICPVPKIKNPVLANHYRPIAILPTLSKMLERVACDQIREYLEREGLLDFRHRHIGEVIRRRLI